MIAPESEDIDYIVEENEKIINAPLKAAFLGLFIFGAGYLTVKKYVLAVLSFIVLTVLSLCLLDGASVIDLGWIEDLNALVGQQQMFVVYCLTAMLFVFLWWVSIIFPVDMSRPMFFYQDVSHRTLFYIWFLPFLPYYWQGKFKRGHAIGLGFLLFPACLLILNMFYTSSDHIWLNNTNERLMAYTWLVLLASIFLMLVSWISNALEVLQIYYSHIEKVKNYRWIVSGVLFMLLMLAAVYLLKDSQQFMDTQDAIIDFINLIK
ncbi:MAG TPA: hypothetical protein PKC21_03615 [Oligoflexia bacterium]|nr:hypothetical protein [Oligoflexia bacterium]HMR24424.1 hypothetical protein [Oligoflexia bacterium]